jgi:hypothetical protein
VLALQEETRRLRAEIARLRRRIQVAQAGGEGKPAG